MNAYLDMFRHYVDFSGRTGRTDFWIAVLINAVIQGILGVIAQVTDLNIIVSLYSLVIFIPFLALGIRRLNDVGKRWTYCLWLFLPVIGWIMVVVQYCKPSQNVALQQ